MFLFSALAFPGQSLAANFSTGTGGGDDPIGSGGGGGLVEWYELSNTKENPARLPAGMRWGTKWRQSITRSKNLNQATRSVLRNCRKGFAKCPLWKQEFNQTSDDDKRTYYELRAPYPGCKQNCQVPERFAVGWNVRIWRENVSGGARDGAFDLIFERAVGRFGPSDPVFGTGATPEVTWRWFQGGSTKKTNLFPYTGLRRGPLGSGGGANTWNRDQCLSRWKNRKNGRSLGRNLMLAVTKVAAPGGGFKRVYRQKLRFGKKKPALPFAWPQKGLACYWEGKQISKRYFRWGFAKRIRDNWKRGSYRYPSGAKLPGDQFGPNINFRNPPNTNGYWNVGDATPASLRSRNGGGVLGGGQREAIMIHWHLPIASGRSSITVNIVGAPGPLYAVHIMRLSRSERIMNLSGRESGGSGVRDIYWVSRDGKRVSPKQYFRLFAYNSVRPKSEPDTTSGPCNPLGEDLCWFDGGEPTISTNLSVPGNTIVGQPTEIRATMDVVDGGLGTPSDISLLPIDTQIVYPGLIRTTHIVPRSQYCQSSARGGYTRYLSASTGINQGSTPWRVDKPSDLRNLCGNGKQTTSFVKNSSSDASEIFGKSFSLDLAATWLKPSLLNPCAFYRDNLNYNNGLLDRNYNFVPASPRINRENRCPRRRNPAPGRALSNVWDDQFISRFTADKYWISGIINNTIPASKSKYITNQIMRCKAKTGVLRDCGSAQEIPGANPETMLLLSGQGGHSDESTDDRLEAPARIVLRTNPAIDPSYAGLSASVWARGMADGGDPAYQNLYRLSVSGVNSIAVNSNPVSKLRELNYCDIGVRRAIAGKNITIPKAGFPAGISVPALADARRRAYNGQRNCYGYALVWRSKGNKCYSASRLLNAPPSLAAPDNRWFLGVSAGTAARKRVVSWRSFVQNNGSSYNVAGNSPLDDYRGSASPYVGQLPSTDDSKNGPCAAGKARSGYWDFVNITTQNNNLSLSGQANSVSTSNSPIATGYSSRVAPALPAGEYPSYYINFANLPTSTNTWRLNADYYGYSNLLWRYRKVNKYIGPLPIAVLAPRSTR